MEKGLFIPLKRGQTRPALTQVIPEEERVSRLGRFAIERTEDEVSKPVPFNELVLFREYLDPVNPGPA